MRVKKLKPGGLFTAGEVEYYPQTYEWVNKKRREIICNNCEGAGRAYDYYEMLSTCPFCGGNGTLILKPATKDKTNG